MASDQEPTVGEVKIDELKRRVRTLSYDSNMHILKKDGFIDLVENGDAQVITLLSGSFAVVSFDVDFLKQVNDGVGGHPAGDSLLKTMALAVSEASWAISETSEGPDPIFFRGKEGDEIVVLLPLVDESEDNVKIYVEQFRCGLVGVLERYRSNPIDEKLRESKLSLSGGVFIVQNGFAGTNPTPHEILSTLFRIIDGPADKAMYQSKVGREDGPNVRVVLTFAQ